MIRLRGFAGVGILLILVVLGGIAAAGSVLFKHKSYTSTLDILGIQTYQAARSGVEWALYNSLQNGTCSNANLNFPGTLTSYRVEIQCSRTAITEDGVLKNIDRITSTACTNSTGCGANSDPLYIERQIQAVGIK